MSITRIDDIDKYILADLLSTQDLFNVSLVNRQSKKLFLEKLRWNRSNTYVNLSGISDMINRVKFISFGGCEYNIENISVLNNILRFKEINKENLHVIYPYMKEFRIFCNVLHIQTKSQI